jgi:hypothetical protein
VASKIATIPTAKTPAASLKSRRKASTVAATENASPMRLIATARPVLPALLAAASSELPPLSVPAAGCAETARGALTAAGAQVVSEMAIADASSGAMHAVLASVRIDGQRLTVLGDRLVARRRGRGDVIRKLLG